MPAPSRERALVHPDAPDDGKPVLGAFVLERAIASGSFATAFLATQLGAERRAVVKIARRDRMRGPLAGHVREAFSNEAKSAARVDHPNLATVYATGELPDGRPAIAMEYFDGQRLRVFLEERAPLEPDELQLVFEPLVSVLERLHGLGIEHRDISPDNILVRPAPPPTLKLLDFGLARMPEVVARELAVHGTWRYMAPEHMRGEPVPGSDIYALGALLWWALTGDELFAEDRDMAPFVRRVLAQREAPDPLEVEAALPARQVEMLRAMLAPDPARRPSPVQVGMMLGSVLRSPWSDGSDRERVEMLMKSDQRGPIAGRRRPVSTRPLGAAPSADDEPAEPISDEPRVLVVEADRQVASSLLGLLLSFELDVATNLARAQHLLSTERFDVVLVSVALVRGASDSALQALRRAVDAAGRRASFVLHGSEDAAPWQALGADAYASLAWPATRFVDLVSAKAKKPSAPPSDTSLRPPISSTFLRPGAGPSPVAPPPPPAPSRPLAEMPLWLGELEDAIAQDDAAATERICGLIAQEATRAEATRLATRTEMLRQAARARRPSLGRLLDQIMEEYETLSNP